MKILAFNGSPRKGGNTELLLNEAVRAAQEKGAEVVLYDLNRLDARPCQNCGRCDETGRCVIEDAMQDIHREIKTADRFILASPIYFFGLSAQTKIMIDRCQAFWYEKYIRKQPTPPGPYGRKGLLILVGGMKKDDKNEGFHCAEVTARAFFRTINVQEHETLSFGSVDAKAAIKEHPSALRDAFEAGCRLAERYIPHQAGMTAGT